MRVLLALLSLLPDGALRVLVRILFTRTGRELDEAAADPAAAQEARLLAIVHQNLTTAFGKARGFQHIRCVDDFRRRVPISTWDDMEPDVLRMVAGEQDVRVKGPVGYYGTTSGTTGRRKLIPVTDAYRAECQITNRVFYRTTLLEMPGFLRGKRLSMRSPKTEDVGPGATAGSITVALGGRREQRESSSGGPLDAVPAAVYRISDFATRYYLCLRFAAQEKITLASAVNPSTLLLFARTLEERAEELATALEQGRLAPEGASLVVEPAIETTLARLAKTDRAAAARIRDSVKAHGFARMADVFPHLVGLACWKGGSAPFYLGRLARSYGPLPALDYGYAASEGMFGAPLSTEGAASVLVPHAHFLELMPEDDVEACRAGEKPTTLLHEVEVGKRYYVLVTTSAGLYRYDMNDIVEVVGHHRRAPLVVFRQKGGAMASLTGEKVGEAHVVSAMDRVETPLDVAGFVAAPLLPENDDEEPRYLVAVDAEGPPSEAALVELAARFDAALCAVNEEYEAKRRSLRLAPAVAAPLPVGAVAAFRARRVAGGAPDAHVKIPHLSADGRLLVELGLDETSPSLLSRLPCRVGAPRSEAAVAPQPARVAV